MPQIPFLVIELEWAFYNVSQIPKADGRDELDISDGTGKPPPRAATVNMSFR